MKNGKKFLFVMAASVLALITGCQNNSSSTSSSSETVTSSQVTTSEVSTSEASSTTSETPTTSEASSSVEESTVSSVDSTTSEASSSEVTSSETTSSEVTSNSSSETSSSEEHVHAYGNWVIVKAPTLTEAGTAKRTCECNDVDLTVVPALSNTEVWSVKSTTPADHFKGGVTIYESVYGEVTVTSVKGDHTFGAWTIVTKPTLTAGGKAERTCSADTYKEEVNLPALTDTTVWSVKSEEPATHFADGTKVYTSKYGEVPVVLPKGEHTYGSWTITVKPTLTTGGKAKHVCTADSHEEVIDIPALSNASVWTVESFPGETHADEGKNVYTSIYGEVEVKIPAGEHVYGAWTITTEPTLTAGGKAEKACTVSGCTHVESVDLPLLSDTTVWKAVLTAPTHTEAGYTTYTSEYGTVVVDGEPALDHIYGEPVYKFNEDKTTCTVTRTCVYDSNHVITKTVDVEKTIVDPTRTSEGTITYFANFDDERFANKTVVDTIPMLAEYEGTYFVTEISAKSSVYGNNKKIEIHDGIVVITTLKNNGSTIIYAEGTITSYDSKTGVITFVTEATGSAESKTYKIVYNRENDAILCNVNFNKEVVGDDVYFGFNGVTMDNTNVKHSSFPIDDRTDYSIKLIEVTIGETKTTYLYNGKNNSLLADVTFSSLSGDFVIGVTEDYKDIVIKDVNGETLFAKCYDKDSYVMVDLDSAYGKYAYEEEEWRFNGAGTVFSGEKEGSYTITEQCTEVYLDGSFYEVTFENGTMNVVKPMVTITFVTGVDGYTIESQDKNINVAATLPVPETEGYIFGGWYYDQELTEKVDGDFIPTENCTLYALMQNNVKYTLVLNNGSENEIVDQIIGQVAVINKPTYEGYKFIGWYIDDALTTEYNIEKLVDVATTLYAKWELVPEYYTEYSAIIELQLPRESSTSGVENGYSWSSASISFDEEGKGSGKAFPFNGTFELVVDDLTGKLQLIQTHDDKGNPANSILNGYYDFTSGIFVLEKHLNNEFNNCIIVSPYSSSKSMSNQVSSYWDEGKTRAVTYNYKDGEVDKSVTFFVFNNTVVFDVTFKDAEGNTVLSQNAYDSESLYVYDKNDALIAKYAKQDGKLVYLDGTEGTYTTEGYTIVSKGTTKVTVNGTEGTYILDGNKLLTYVKLDEVDTYLEIELGEEGTCIVTKPMVTVTYSSSQTAVDSATVNKNIVLVLHAPVSETHIFKGWYLEETFETAVLNDFVPIEDITLYAKWVEKKSVTTIVGNGYDNKTYVVAQGDNVNLDSYEFKNGMYLEGWYLDEECNQKFDSSSVINNDITLYANWVKGCALLGSYSGTNVWGATSAGGTTYGGTSSYSLTINSDGTTSGAIKAKTTEYDEATGRVTFTNSSDSKYYGYYDSKNKILVVNSSSSTKEYAISADINVFVLGASKAILSTNSENAGRSYWDSGLKFAMGIAITNSTETYDKVIYCDGEKIYADVKFVDSKGNNIAPKDVYKKDEVIIKYISSDIVIKEYVYSTLNGLVSKDSTAGTHTVGEYTVVSKGEGNCTVNDKEAKYTLEDNIMKILTKDKTLYIEIDMTGEVWTVSKPMVTISFSTEHDERESVSVNKNTEYTLPVLSFEGYRFDGWYVSDTSTTKLTSYIPTNNITLYAKWTAYYTLSFDSNGGTEVASIKNASGESITKPSDPKKEGYIFNGWYTSIEGGEEFVFSNGITTDTTIYAHWAETISVTVHNNNGEADPDVVLIKKGTTPTFSTPTRTGYIFIGWYIDELCETAYVSENKDSNVEVYAKWIVSPEFIGKFYGYNSDHNGISFQTASDRKVSSTYLEIKEDGNVSGKWTTTWKYENWNSSTKILKLDNGNNVCFLTASDGTEFVLADYNKGSSHYCDDDFMVYMSFDGTVDSSTKVEVTTAYWLNGVQKIIKIVKETKTYYLYTNGYNAKTNISGNKAYIDVTIKDSEGQVIAFDELYDSTNKTYPAEFKIYKDDVEIAYFKTIDNNVVSYDYKDGTYTGSVNGTISTVVLDGFGGATITSGEGTTVSATYAFNDDKLILTIDSKSYNFTVGEENELTQILDGYEGTYTCLESTITITGYGVCTVDGVNGTYVINDKNVVITISDNTIEYTLDTETKVASKITYKITNGGYGLYSFIYKDSQWESTNKGEDSSKAKIKITASDSVKVEIVYWASSESENRYDYFHIDLNGTKVCYSGGSSTTADDAKTYTVTLNKGDVLELIYEKDGSTSYGSDTAYITSFKIDGIEVTSI